MTVIAQDDHLTAGAWAACALGGLLHKLIIGLGTFESLAEDPSDSSVLALVFTSMLLTIRLQDSCLRELRTVNQSGICACPH